MSPVYSAMSNDTLTCDMAARLYTSVGRILNINLTRQVESCGVGGAKCVISLL